MRFIKNPDTLLGIGLLMLGIALSLVSYLALKSTPFTALGISAFIIGYIYIALSRTRPNISPEISIYIVSLTLLLALTTAIMAAYVHNRLDAYLAVYLVETLVLTEIYDLNPKARRGVDVITRMLFLGFLFLVVLEVYKIMADK